MGWYDGSSGGGTLSDPPFTIEGNPTSATANTSAFTIGSLTAKTVPASTDQLMLQDNAASGALKSVPWSSMPGAGGGMSIGGAVTGGTTGSVLFVGSGPVLAQDNAELFWDDTNFILKAGKTFQQNVNGVFVNALYSVYNASGDNWFIGEAGNTTTTGSDNLGMGGSALMSLTNGGSNVGIGVSAGIHITGGGSNMAIGTGALFSSTNGYDNVAIGTHALFSDSGGYHSVAIGSSALGSFVGSAAGDNTAIGYHAGQNLGSGSYTFNTFIGSGSGGSITSGSNNTLLGGWGGPAGTMSNVIALSDGAGNLLLDHGYTNSAYWTAKDSLWVSKTDAATTTSVLGMVWEHLSSGSIPAGTGGFGFNHVIQLQNSAGVSKVAFQDSYFWNDPTSGFEYGQYERDMLINGSLKAIYSVAYDGSFHYSPFYMNTSSRSPGPSGEMSSVYSNAGAASTINLQDASSYPGRTITFMVSNSGGVQINAPTGKVIHFGAIASAASGRINSTTVGAAITLTADNSGNYYVTGTSNKYIWTTDGNPLAVLPPAGTATVAPLQFTSGTNLTTAAVGACEFDGTAFYQTAVASARQVVDTEQVIVQSANRTFTNNTSAQAIFNATTNGAITLAATTTYEFEMVVAASGFSSSAHTINLGFGGTAAFTSIAYYYESQTGSTLAGPNADSSGFVAVATATGIVASSTTTGLLLYVRGTMRVNTGGTVIPQLTQVTASAAAVVQANSFFRCWPIGSNTVTNVGNWS